MTLPEPSRLLGRFVARHYGKYRGEVIDNEDPSALGRLKVKVPQVLGDVESGWALPCFPVPGDDSGVWAIPPTGTAVWVEFEDGDPSRPVWVGGWFTDGAVPESATPMQIVIKTPGGHMVVIDDDAGKIEVAESGGAKIVVDSSGTELSKGGQKIVIGDSSVSVNDGALEVM